MNSRTVGARGFASDNNSGVHPEVMAALANVNSGHVEAYGYDPVTVALKARFREHFGPDANAFPVFNGTGANVAGIAGLTRPHHAVICSDVAHLHVDECGAPEQIGGFKLLTVPTPDGKLTPELIERGIAWRPANDEHAVQPRLISITNSTEAGTVYSADEVMEIADYAHGRDLLLHVDGARIANAAAAHGRSLGAITTNVGVDILSFGGTKNGILGGEAVVFLTAGLGEGFEFVRKRTMQLGSKMRFISAQLAALLTDDLWQRSAEQANGMARLLGDEIARVDGVTVIQEVEANAVFASLPGGVAEQVLEEAEVQGWALPFTIWDPATDTVRLMCSWDTEPADVEWVVSRIGSAIESSA